MLEMGAGGPQRQEHAPQLAVTATVGLDDRVLEAGAPLCALLGLRPSQIVGRTVAELTVPDEGTPLWQQMTLTLVRSADGRPSHYRGQLMTAGERHEEELEWLATHDALTGLPNRRTFDSRFMMEMARVEREHGPLALAMLDIDHFKHVNDTYGHQMGDTVLARTGEILNSQVRTHELLARVGGEEFAWILTGVDADGAKSAVERARTAVAATQFGEAGHVTLSAGLATLERRMDGISLYRAADLALLAAKREGRDRIVMASAPDQRDLGSAVGF